MHAILFASVVLKYLYSATLSKDLLAVFMLCFSCISVVESLLLDQPPY